MPYAGYHLAYPELVNSHLFLPPVNHIRPVEDHSEARDGVEVGDGVGECQEKDYNQESLFYISKDIQGAY
jgi:hypothetical protein